MKKTPQNSLISSAIPSFSSSLLDEIYRSIDEGNEKSPNPKSLRNRVYEKQSNANGGAVREIQRRRMNEDEIEARTRAYLVENWMEKNKLNKKSMQFESFDNNPLFFRSSSSSSDSYSSLEREFSIKKNPKSINTSKSEPGEFSYLENYHNSQNGEKNPRDLKKDENLIKSKSRALKIYNNLKKIKQPISPGGRLTTFLNSLFNNGTPKKSKSPRVSISTEDSTCSSASSYTRSCMSRNSSTNRKSSGEEKRKVSFCPVNVIIGENNRACEHNCVRSDISGKRDYDYRKGFENFEKDEDGDMASDSSSDLFELDHLAFGGNNEIYCDDLPVYETTSFDKNMAIASGLVR